MEGSHLNTILLGIVVALGSFIAVQVWGLNTKVAQFEVELSHLKLATTTASVELSSLKEKISRVRTF